MTTEHELPHAEYLKDFAPDIKEKIVGNAKAFSSLLSEPDEVPHGLFMTSSLNSYISEHVGLHPFIQDCIFKHFTFDFGETCSNDIIANFQAMLGKDRVFSYFNIPEDEYPQLSNEKIYVVTASDWDHTMVMLKSDY